MKICSWSDLALAAVRLGQAIRSKSEKRAQDDPSRSMSQGAEERALKDLWLSLENDDPVLADILRDVPVTRRETVLDRVVFLLWGTEAIRYSAYLPW